MQTNSIISKIDAFIIKNNFPQSYRNLIIEGVYGHSLSSFLMVDKHNVTLLNDFIDEFNKTRQPINYILGFDYFMNNKYLVDSRVLIPRVETEELVNYVIKYIKKNFQKNETITIADVCCGSGIIGCSIFLLLKDQYNIKLIFTDISNDALNVCKINGEKLNVKATYYEGDLLQPVIDKKIDLVVANPPYIADSSQLEDIVLKEPEIALFGGVIGYEPYLKLMKQCDSISNVKAFIFEIGDGQYENLLDAEPNLNLIKDMFARERIVIKEY